MMPSCRGQPFIRPGVLIAPPTASEAPSCNVSSRESCDYCGSLRVEWRKCKLVCADCRQIVKSCADL